MTNAHNILVYNTGYYPFGMKMASRGNSDGSYRYAFQGMESDNEVSGNNNSYTTQFRQYDPRLGRWKSLDPLMRKYPNMSPYFAFNNNPIYFIDPDGREGQDWVKGGTRTDGTKAGNNTWHWRSDVTNDKELADVGGLERMVAGSEVEGSLDGGERVSTLLLGDGKAKYKYMEEAIASAKAAPIENNTESSYSIQTNFASNPLVSQGYKISDVLSLRKNWGRTEDWETFTNGIHTGLLVVGGGVLGGEAILAIEAIGGFQAMGQGAKLYHNTFGKNGGYVNMGIDLGLQKLANPNGDVNYYSLVGSSFLPGNSLKKIGAFEVSTAFIDVTSQEISVGFPNGTKAFNTTSTMLWKAYGNSKWGTPFLGLYFNSGTKAVEGNTKD